jgi:hypothetical protein
VSASLPSEELPRRNAGPPEHTLMVKLAPDMAWPLPLPGLVNLLGTRDDFWPAELASASGKTDGQQQAKALPEQARRGT